MRLIVTSDLHYNVARSKAPTEALAREVCRVGGDCLLFVGDSASTDLAILEQVFALFESFKGPRLAVAGNHELWGGLVRTEAGDHESIRRYEKDIAEACRRSGVHYLDESPFRMNGLSFVGNVGWYDFSFRPATLGIPLRFYQHKVGPGAAEHFEKHRHLVENATDIPESAREITSRWMDGERVRLPMGDVEFTQLMADKLRQHLNQVHADSDEVVVAVHHLPFAEIVPRSIIPNWAFASGFLGSELLGETILEFPKVKRVFCGHSHRALRCRKGDLVCQSIGSTYKEKQYEVVDL